MDCWHQGLRKQEHLENGNAQNWGYGVAMFVGMTRTQGFDSGSEVGWRKRSVKKEVKELRGQGVERVNHMATETI